MKWCVHWFEITGLENNRFPWFEFFFFFILLEIFSTSTVRCHHDDLVELGEICVEIDAIMMFFIKRRADSYMEECYAEFGMCDEVLGAKCEVGKFRGLRMTLNSGC